MRALITGGSDGLGAAVVRQLTQAGAQIWIIDKSAPQTNPSLRFLPCDLAQPDDIAGLPAKVQQAGPFDLVVMSAGINAVGPFEAMPLTTIRNLHAINCAAPILLAQHLLAQDMIAAGGRLIFIASVSHFTGYPGASVYAGGKDALVAFARSLRRPLWADQRITVQVATPGPMRTAHAARYAPPGSTGRGRACPDRIARAILRSKRRAVIVPGVAARMMALFGRLFPVQATQAMRKTLYERLP